MAKLTKLLKNVHFSVHFLASKQTYSTGLYTGGIILSKWSSLSKKQQQKALQKDWYLRWSYRNPKTGKLERQDNIRAGVNRFKTKKERIQILRTLEKNLLALLEQGYNPFDIETVPDALSVEAAFEFALKIKQKTLSETSYQQFKWRLNEFKKYLINNGFEKRYITSVDKKAVVNYLNHVLEKTSARNRNNTRTDISSMFQLLEDNDIIPYNFVSKIAVLKAPPKRNKTYSDKMVEDLYYYLEKNNTHLLLFIKFVSYNFLRPIEVCRLRVADINLKDKTLIVKAKNKLIKQKIIPQILLDDLLDLKNYKNDDFLFTRYGKPAPWDATENNRRDYFSKAFRKVKKHFGLGNEYGIYSFRHTFITKLYRQLRKELTPFETKSKLLLITGHSTMDALEKYLRELDVELPEDYSKLIDKNYKS